MKKIVALALCLALALALCTVAFATETVQGYLKATSKDAVASSLTTLTYTAAKEPTKNDDGDTVAQGCVAHYNDGTYDYVVVASLAEADVVLYSDTACKNVVMYLAKETPDYIVGAAFTNFGKDCGQILKPATYDATKTYYTAEWEGNTVLYVENATSGAYSLMVAGKLVGVDSFGFVEANKHVATPVVADGKVTGYKCATCGVAAVKAANYASIPTGAQKFQGNDATTWYYFPAAAAAATTTGVASAKTFDAGVALYAGMALMSVAGSAVVIGKKKEF